MHKSDNEIVDKIIKLCPQNRAKMKFYHFCEVASHFCFRHALRLFRLHSVSKNDAGIAKKWVKIAKTFVKMAKSQSDRY